MSDGLIGTWNAEKARVAEDPTRRHAEDQTCRGPDKEPCRGPDMQRTRPRRMMSQRHVDYLQDAPNAAYQVIDSSAAESTTTITTTEWRAHSPLLE